MNTLVVILLIAILIYTVLSIINEVLRMKQNYSLTDRVRALETTLKLTMQSAAMTRNKLKRLEEKHREKGRCNECENYEGVLGVPGHAPCKFWEIGGVMWDDYCSRWERAKK